jgi:hypothetical protein
MSKSDSTNAHAYRSRLAGTRRHLHCRDDGAATRFKQRKTPGSFLPGVLL